MTIVIKGPCRDCGSAGVIPVGEEPHYRRGDLIVPTRPCPGCAARTALAFLLVRIGSWTDARWDQHVRYEYGDEVADRLIRLLDETRIPVAEYAERPVSVQPVEVMGHPRPSDAWPTCIAPGCDRPALKGHVHCGFPHEDLRTNESARRPEGKDVIRAAMLRGQAEMIESSSWPGKNAGATKYEADELRKKAEALDPREPQRTGQPVVEAERELPGISARTARIRAQQLGSCPCLHIEPCDPRCTCVAPSSSIGCRRCCSYGSPEQQTAAAKRLARACTDFAGVSHPGDWDRTADESHCAKCERCQVYKKMADDEAVRHATRADRFATALAKLNEVRNSIVGIQGFNFSEHAYPMVATLDEAGFAGLPYPEARENVGTLIERANKAEARVAALERFAEKVSSYNVTHGDLFERVSEAVCELEHEVPRPETAVPDVAAIETRGFRLALRRVGEELSALHRDEGTEFVNQRSWNAALSAVRLWIDRHYPEVTP